MKENTEAGIRIGQTAGNVLWLFRWAAKTIAEMGWRGFLLALLSVLLVALAAVRLDAPYAQEVAGTVEELRLPASPLDLQLADVVCNAPVAKTYQPVGNYWSYTALVTTAEGASVHLRWTDSPAELVPGERLSDKVAAQVNGGPVAPIDIDDRARQCFLDRAKVIDGVPR